MSMHEAVEGETKLPCVAKHSRRHPGRPAWHAATLPVLLGAALLMPSICSAAVQECQARVLQPVTDDMGQTWQPGSVVPVDIARDSSVAGGQFCAHGGACLPRQAAGGQPALTLTNCRVGESIGNGDFRLVPDARPAGKTAAAAMDARASAEQRLSNLGFSNAAAGSLADEYVNHPRSARGQLVTKALAGSPEALRTLQAQFP